MKGGVDELNKRLEFLKMNRLEIEQRSKNKSDIAPYSQTSKNRNKRAFDFKGKFYAGEGANRGLY